MNLQNVSAYSWALGNAECTAGSFYYEPATGQMIWSDEMYRIHGYRRGDIVPTMELLLAHKHPADRESSLRLLESARQHGGLFCNYHRVVDAKEKIHRVLTSGEITYDHQGNVANIHGFMIDLTATRQREVEQAASEAVQRATATRGTIERATGVLMGYLRIDAGSALRMLLTASQHTNIKLARLASDLLEAADARPDTLDEFIHTLLAPTKPKDCKAPGLAQTPPGQAARS